MEVYSFTDSNSAFPEPQIATPSALRSATPSSLQSATPSSLQSATPSDTLSATLSDLQPTPPSKTRVSRCQIQAAVDDFLKEKLINPRLKQSAIARKHRVAPQSLCKAVKRLENLNPSKKFSLRSKEELILKEKLMSYYQETGEISKEYIMEVAHKIGGPLKPKPSAGWCQSYIQRYPEIHDLWKISTTGRLN